MDAGEHLWPLVEGLLDSHDVAGVAVAVVHEGGVSARGFGVRDIDTGAPVTPETMFHLASLSKPFVATAVVSLATTGDAGEPVLDLDAPVIDWIAELTLADGRQGEVTARGLLSHTSGLPDVPEYGWHDPQLGDDALSEFARSLSGRRLKFEPGTEFSYSNAGYELLGLLLSRVSGHDVRGRHASAPAGPARDAATARSSAPRCRPTSRPPRTSGCRWRSRGRLPLHPAPRPQLDPALQPGRAVPLDDGASPAGRAAIPGCSTSCGGP